MLCWWNPEQLLCHVLRKEKQFPESETLTCRHVLRKAMKWSRSCRLVLIFVLKVCSLSKSFVALSIASVEASDEDAASPGVLVLFSCSVRALKGLSCLLVPLGGLELVLLVSLGGCAYLSWSRICLRISAS